MKSIGSFAQSRNTVRDEVLSILSDEFPLSTKEIYSRVKSSGKDVTYQATHKAIEQLLENKVIEKMDTKYRIRKEWIAQIRDHLTILEHQYQEKPSAKRILKDVKKDTVKLHFTSITTMCIFVAELLTEYREQSEKVAPHFGYLRHALWPLKFEPSQYYIFSKFDDNNPYNRAVLLKNYPFDKWIMKYYKLVNPGNRFVFEPKEPWEEDLIAKGDLVLQIRYSEKTIERIDKIYKKISNLSDLFDTYFVNVEKDDGFDIDITISLNFTLAKLITGKIKAYFGEK